MRNRKRIGNILLALSLAVATARAATLTVPAGAILSVRMTDSVDSKKSRTGETFRAMVDAPLTVNGKTLVPKGAEAIGRVTEVQSAGRFKGRSLVAIELTALNFNGKSVTIRTSAYQEAGSSRTRQTAIIVGGSTVVGTLIGAMAGAPWLGTKVGAAAGMVANTVRSPGMIRIPAESLLLFTLQSPLPLEDDAPLAKSDAVPIP
jgi:hypothetical protein